MSCRYNGIPLTINVSQTIECKLGKKSTTIRVDYGSENTVPSFAKDGGNNRLVLTWPVAPQSTPLRNNNGHNNNIRNNVNNGLVNGNGNGLINGNGHSSPMKSKMAAPPPPVPNRVESVNGYH